MLREIALAVAVVVGCSAEAVALCAVDRTVDPHVAVLWWSDGTREEVATINGAQCQCVRTAMPRRVPGARIIESYCDHRNGFQPGWDTIKGYNR